MEATKTLVTDPPPDPLNDPIELKPPSNPPNDLIEPKPPCDPPDDPSTPSRRLIRPTTPIEPKLPSDPPNDPIGLKPLTDLPNVLIQLGGAMWEEAPIRLVTSKLNQVRFENGKAQWIPCVIKVIKIK